MKHLSTISCRSLSHTFWQSKCSQSAVPSPPLLSSPSPYLHEWVQVSPRHRRPHCVEVVLLELLGAPGATGGQGVEGRGGGEGGGTCTWVGWWTRQTGRQRGMLQLVRFSQVPLCATNQWGLQMCECGGGSGGSEERGPYKGRWVGGPASLLQGGRRRRTMQVVSLYVSLMSPLGPTQTVCRVSYADAGAATAARACRTAQMSLRHLAC